MTIGLACGALAIAAGRASGIALPEWTIAAGGGALGLLVASGLAWARTWTPRRAAREVDQRANLKDTLGSALELSSTHQADPFVRTILDDAEIAASRVDVRRVVPVRARWDQWSWALLGVVACVAATQVPTIEARNSKPKPTVAKADAIESVQQARRAVETSRGNTGETQRDLAAFDALEKELASGKADSEQTIAKAAEQVTRVAERAENRAEKLQAEADRVKQLLAAPPDRKESESQLGRALDRADADAAAKAAAALRENLRQMDPKERQRVADELKEIAQRLEEREKAAGSSGAGDSSPAQASPNDQAARPTEGAGSPGVESAASGRERAGESGRNDLAKALREASEQLTQPDSQPAAPGAEGNPSPDREKSSGTPDPNRKPGDQPQPTDQKPGGASGGEKSQPNSQSPKPSGTEKQGSSGEKNADQNKAGDKKSDGGAQGGRPSQGSQSDQKPSDQSQPSSAERQSKPGEGKSGENKSGESKPGEASGSQKKPSDTKPDGTTPDGTTPDGTKPGEASGGNDKAGAKQADGAKPSEQKTAEQKPGDQKPGEQKSADAKSGDPKAGDQKSGDQKSGDQKQGGTTPAAQPSGSDTQPQPSGGGASDPASKDPTSTEQSPKSPSDSPQKPNASGKKQSGENPSNTGVPQPQDAPSDQPNSPDSGSPNKTPAAKPDAGRSGDKPSQKNSGKAGGKSPDQSAPGEKQPTDQPSGEEAPRENNTPTPKDAIEGLEKALEHAADLQKQADKERRDAGELRKQAEEILKNATPEEKQKLMELAQRLAKQMQNQPGPHESNAPRPGSGQQGATSGPPGDGPGSTGAPTSFGDAPENKPGQTAPLDVRQNLPTAERVVAKWFNPNAGGGGVSREAASEDLRQATAGAEKAIEQQVVPGRHSDLIRRVFRRYAERTQTPAKPVPVEEAKDATRK